MSKTFRSLLAIDPGKSLGWALFADAGYRCSGQVDGDAPGDFSAYAPDLVVVELPESRGGRTSTPTDDLIILSFRAGLAVPPHTAYELVRPSHWKGQLPKAITKARAIKQVGPSPRGSGRMGADEWDAIALALWRLGRL